jgi:ribosomal protein S18 acetylase RimI-like enzyme
MSETVKFGQNEASEAEIARHLQRCDSGFTPPLSKRVDIGDYASKIASNAVRFEAWSGPELIGLVAAYCNDAKRRAAFVTSVSVIGAWQGRGLASRLMNRCVSHARTHGFRRIELDVVDQNAAALKLYEKTGFVKVGIGNRMTMMLVAAEAPIKAE